MGLRLSVSINDNSAFYLPRADLLHFVGIHMRIYNDKGG